LFAASTARVRNADIAMQNGRYGENVRCPFCRANDDKVVDSRVADEGAAIRRRRECLACGRRYTTYERVEDVGLQVRKRSGTLEPFDRAKLRAGVERAATNRLDAATLDAVVAGVEEEMRDAGGTVASDRVGMAVLERLRGLDHVAYLRFASVYKGFEDLSDFEREVGELQKTTEPKRR
jgi:transcriptional repressor NrdR